MFFLGCFQILGTAHGLSNPTQSPSFKPEQQNPRLDEASTFLSRRPTVFPNSVGVGEENIKVLVRQTGQTKPSEAAIGIPKTCSCRHGFPQVFAMDPLPHPDGKRMNSGLLKLTCPLLVRAVDDMEDEGFLQRWNAELLGWADHEVDEVNPTEDEMEIQRTSHKEKSMNASDWQQAVHEGHQVHAAARARLLQSPDDFRTIQTKLGDRGAQAFFNAGVAGATCLSSPPSLLLASPCTDSVTSTAGRVEKYQDLKCLHAWLGDYLFRGPTASPVGAKVAKELSVRGVDITGTPHCWAQCSKNHMDNREGTSMSDQGNKSNMPTISPPKPRNKQRLKTGKEVARRRRKKRFAENNKLEN